MPRFALPFLQIGFHPFDLSACKFQIMNNLIRYKGLNLFTPNRIRSIYQLVAANMRPFRTRSFMCVTYLFCYYRMYLSNLYLRRLTALFIGSFKSCSGHLCSIRILRRFVIHTIHRLMIENVTGKTDSAGLSIVVHLMN